MKNDVVIITLHNPQLSRSTAAITRTNVVAEQTAGCDTSSKPTISTVTPIAASSNVTITIDGSCFGTHAPYNGGSDFLDIRDDTADWDAGCNSCISITVTRWTDNQIVIAGFSSPYGQGRYYLSNNDAIIITLHNPQLVRSAAAVYRTKVGGQ